MVIPILPFFIATTFCGLAYEGTITRQLPVFLAVVLIVIVGHYIWLAILYGIAGALFGRESVEGSSPIRPAYLTAVGTMSSAATLAVALQGANRAAPPLRRDMVSFGIPLFANIHLCGSVLTEVFFVMTIGQMINGSMPELSTMILFCLLLGVFAIGAPGVPAAPLWHRLALLRACSVSAIRPRRSCSPYSPCKDSFGTACNITGDGALTLMLTGYADRHGIEESDEHRQLFDTEDEKKIGFCEIASLRNGFTRSLKLHIVLEAAFCGFLFFMRATWKSDNHRFCFGKATIGGRAFKINDALPAVHNNCCLETACCRNFRAGKRAYRARPFAL